MKQNVKYIEIKQKKTAKKVSRKKKKMKRDITTNKEI